jgi:hypothetical protein
MEFASRHPAEALNFEMVIRFLENLLITRMVFITKPKKKSHFRITNYDIYKQLINVGTAVA